MKNSCFFFPLVILHTMPAAQGYEELQAVGAIDDGSIARKHHFLSVHAAVLFAQQTTGKRCGQAKVGQLLQICYTNPFYNISHHTSTCVQRFNSWGCMERLMQVEKQDLSFT